MSVIWSPVALERVREVADHIQTDDKAAAQDWVIGLFKRIDKLENYPRSGRIVPEVNRRDIREVIFGKYRIIYRINADRIVILTIRHGRQLFKTSETED